MMNSSCKTPWGGGNLLLLAKDQTTALRAAAAAVKAMRSIRDIILPFPNGVVRSGSKVGSRYKALIASTNEAWCPTLRGRDRGQPAGSGH